MKRDRNLLFGILAVQLQKISASKLTDAAGEWARNPSQDLAHRLVEMGLLSESDRALVNHMVGAALNACQGDASAALTSFGGDEAIRESFGGKVMRSEMGMGFFGWGKKKVAPEDPLVDPLGDVPIDVLEDVLEEPQEQVPGVQEALGRYTDHREYAKGGMGHVLVVHDGYLNREIALKELLPEVMGILESETGQRSPSSIRMAKPIVARFLQEARITGQLEHPSIVPVYELGYREDGTLYYTMKLVRGKTLAQAIKDGKNLEERLLLLPRFVDLCQAIAYAHSRRVIHRDIKPSNVMVGEFGETVVLDWGIAKIKGMKDVHANGLAESFKAINSGKESDGTKTVYGEALGTPAYMSPEQAQGQLDKIDERSDVYSLGAVLYELLTGHAPFEGKRVADILHSVRTQEPSPIESYEPKVPPELAAICMRALAKSPYKRYRTVHALIEDIERFQSGSLVHSYEYTRTEHARRIFEHHKALVITTTTMLVVLGALTTFYFRNIHSANSEMRQTLARETSLASAADQVRSQWLNEVATKTLDVKFNGTVETLARALQVFANSVTLEAAEDHADAPLGLWVGKDDDATARETLKWQVGDRIMRVNGIEVKTMLEIEKAATQLRDTSKNEPLVVEMMRDNRKYVLRYVLHQSTY